MQEHYYKFWRELIKPKGFEIEKDTQSLEYAKFVVRPLERGFGVTLGNSLRRILLSSMMGSAVTAVKFDGVLHEFSTLPDVLEDVSDIILNLKQVRFKKQIDNVSDERVTVVYSGKSTFTAGDIGKALSSFQVLNPDLVICHTEPNVTIKMEIIIDKGRGYVPAEENKASNAPQGTIAVDAIFTPIKNVKYGIENYRVEQRTDYEKLILEVATDGTIHPEDAVKQASRILIQHLMIITDENITFDNKEDKKEDVVDEQVLQLRKVLKTPLEDLDLSVRAFNCLKAAKINSLSELVQYEQEDLMKFRNFGQKSLSEIEQVLIERGLSFGMDLGKLGLDKLDLQ